jgi:hypothetical protein
LKSRIISALEPKNVKLKESINKKMYMPIEVSKGTHDVTVPKREKIVYKSSSCKMIEVANLLINKHC